MCNFLENVRDAIEDAFMERVLDPLAEGSGLWERAVLMVETIVNDGPTNAEVRMRNTLDTLQGYKPYHDYPIHPTRQKKVHLKSSPAPMMESGLRLVLSKDDKDDAYTGPVPEKLTGHENGNISSNINYEGKRVGKKSKK